MLTKIINQSNNYKLEKILVEICNTYFSFKHTSLSTSTWLPVRPESHGECVSVC